MALYLPHRPPLLTPPFTHLCPLLYPPPDCPLTNGSALSPLPFGSHNGPLAPFFHPDVLAQVPQVLSECRELSLASSSRSSYSSVQRLFLDYCAAVGLSSPTGLPIPASPATVQSFLAWCALRGVQASSLAGYSSAINRLHLEMGFPPPHPSDRSLKWFLQGVGRWQLLHQLRSHKRTRAPLLPSTLLHLHPFLSTSLSDLRLWCMLLLGVFGLFRSGELTVPSSSSFDPRLHPTRSHTRFTFSAGSLSYSSLTLPTSKTDKQAVGVLVSLPLFPDHPNLCPTSHLLTFLHRTQATGHPHHHLLAIEGAPYTKPAFLTEFRSLLHRAGLRPDAYAGHSLRIGGATAAAEAGLPTHLIKQLGRWTSDCFLLYTRLRPATVTAATRLLLPTVGPSNPPTAGLPLGSTRTGPALA